MLVGYPNCRFCFSGALIQNLSFAHTRFILIPVTKFSGINIKAIRRVSNMTAKEVERSIQEVVEEDADRYGHRRGLFVIGQREETVKILNDEKLQPQAW
jgi:hypothetical protein